VTWIVADDQPFTVVESLEFHDMIKLCNQNAKIPSADTIRNQILQSFENHQIKIKDELQVNNIVVIKYVNIINLYNK